MKHEKGFTLIEVLVAVSAFSVVGILVSYIMVNVLRTATKSKLTNSIRANGSLAIEKMSRNLRSAKSISSPTLPCSSTGTVVSNIDFDDAAGVAHSYVCDANTIRDNSVLTNIAYRDITTVQNQSLLDVTSVKIATTCSFTCFQSSNASNPQISIDFDLTGVSSSPLIEHSIYPLHFKTAIFLENIHR